MSAERRFLAKIVVGDGCWEWTAHHDPKGYGRFYCDGTMGYAHRFAYELFVGPIPGGLVIDHLCKNRGCVRPDHMEPVTLEENSRRQVPHNSLKTECPRGHKYDYTVPGASEPRGCTTCNQRRAHEQKARLKAARSQA